jgi:hypothetical protein
MSKEPPRKQFRPLKVDLQGQKTNEFILPDLIALCDFDCAINRLTEGDIRQRGSYIIRCNRKGVGERAPRLSAQVKSQRLPFLKRAAVPAACALMTCPVVDAASSPARSRTKRPIFSGDEIPSGESFRSFDLNSSEIHPVSVGPGVLECS